MRRILSERARERERERARERERESMDLGRAVVTQHKLAFSFGDYTPRGGA